MKLIVLLVVIISTIFAATDLAAQDATPLLTKKYDKPTTRGFTEGEQAMRKRAGAAIKTALAKVDLEWYDQLCEIGSRRFFENFDTTIPLSYMCRHMFKTDSALMALWKNYREAHAKLSKQYPEVGVYINPVEWQRQDHRISGAFDHINVPGARFAIRSENPQRGPFIAVFLGAFGEITADRKEDRPPGAKRYPSLVAPTLYDSTQSYLNIQSIYVLIEGEHELAQRTLAKIDFAALNALIEKY